MDVDLPMETVFFAQLVNKTFFSTITNSRPLQVKLFFAVDASSELSINPLLAKEYVLTRLPLWLTDGATSEAPHRFKYCDGLDRVRLWVMSLG